MHPVSYDLNRLVCPCARLTNRLLDLKSHSGDRSSSGHTRTQRNRGKLSGTGIATLRPCSRVMGNDHFFLL